jgi:hypothetical protein
MSKKPVCWSKVKKDYIQGVTPADLVAKYPELDMTAKKLGDRASQLGWAKKKQEISRKIEDDFEESIKELTRMSFNTLKDIINTSDNEGNKINAVRAVLDVSGLKNSKKTLDVDDSFKKWVESLND